MFKETLDKGLLAGIAAWFIVIVVSAVG